MRNNIALLSYNRGLISPKALARVDLDRTRLSAEVFNNWIAKTQGALTIRPGTKFFGSSKNDTGAEFIEFVAATDDVAMVELVDSVSRFWLGSDAHELSLLSRPSVATAVDLSDTGWEETSIGGALAASAVDLIPIMTSETTDGVQVTESSFLGGFPVEGFRACDDNLGTGWVADNDTGEYLNVDFGSGNAKTVVSYSVRASADSSDLDGAPGDFDLLSSNFDTGSYDTDTGKWTLADSRPSETGWSVSERRTYAISDTGSSSPRRHWRLNVRSAENPGIEVFVAVDEFELLGLASATAHVVFNGSKVILNSGSIGSIARIQKHVVVDTGDKNVEHGLVINVSRGPITMRIGSSSGDDDYLNETDLGTGWHNIEVTPSDDFYLTFQTNKQFNRIIGSVEIGDSGIVEVPTAWGFSDIDNVRYDQSADVIYADCAGCPPKKIERRGTGRSWSIVDYAPDNGPFLSSPSSTARMTPGAFFGNTTIASDIPFFKSAHVGALIRIFHEGQGGQWALGNQEAKTDTIEVTGIGDTGTETSTNERRISFSVSGEYVGTIIIERSFDSPDFGFKGISSNVGTASDTGTFNEDIDDTEDNIKVWYRARMSSWISGSAIVSITYGGGGVTGIARVTDFSSNTVVGAEVLERFSSTGSSDNWQEGFWSSARGYPSAVSLHGGRLFHANGGNLFASVSDDFENFDEDTEGDAAPFTRTLGSGPVDNIFYLISLLRLIIGTAGSEIALRSSSLDEAVTPENSSARTFSTQGSSNLRAVKMDTRAIHLQRSRQRVFMIGFGLGKGEGIGDYEGFELTLLVPDLLKAGVVSIAIQRQPDTRLHCVLANGTVGTLIYEPQEEVICWSTWSTDGEVLKAMVLPGVEEDAVYYHIKRTINAQSKRYLEKWAKESECIGDTGLSWLADCAVSYSDTGRTSTLSGYSHLAGKEVVVWADDTGQTNAGKDLSPDVDGVQTLYTVDTGAGTISLGENVHHAVAGLPYMADWKSAKLAYGAEGGTALAQMKRVNQIAFSLFQTHNNGLFFGGDTGHLEGLPRVFDDGKEIDGDKIIAATDAVAMPFDGTHDTDARIHLRAKAPRPATVLAAIPTPQTNERV